jgi:hypothetical protein
MCSTPRNIFKAYKSIKEQEMTNTADNANSLVISDDHEHVGVAIAQEMASDQTAIDHLTRELVIFTTVRRALLLRGRRCLALMAPRRRQLAALLRRRNQHCHAIDRVGSVRIVDDKRANGVGGRKKRSVGMVDATIAAAEATSLIDNQLQQRNGGDDNVAISISVLPFDDATLNHALDQAIDAAVGSLIWTRDVAQEC